MVAMRRMMAAVLVAMLTTLAACSGSGPVLEVASAPAGFGANAPGGREYRLGSGDKVRVIVFGEQDLSGEFVVGDSGSVGLPLIGPVKAQGATVPEFQERIVNRLRDGYLNDPRVSVEVLNYRPFFITGEVRNGGEYPYKASLTVQDAVGMAGGYSYRAETSYAYLRRAGEDREIKVSLQARVAVNPGDSIRIPERFF